jgi:hypothetical protein
MNLCQSSLLSFLSLLCLSTVALGIPQRPDVTRPFCPGLPCTRGIISVSSAINGSHIGYISNSYGPVPNEYTTEYLLTTSVNDSLIVYLPSINIRSDLLYKSFNILATNPANSEWNYLGAGTSVGTANLPSTTFAMIMGTKVIPAGPAQAGYVQRKYFVGESQIWSLNCLRQFSSTWVNPDRTTSSPTYFFWPPEHGLPFGLLGMTMMRLAAISSGTIPLTFTFEPRC